MKKIVIILSLLSTTAFAADRVYRCQGTGGRYVYSQVPCGKELTQENRSGSVTYMSTDGILEREKSRKTLSPDTEPEKYDPANKDALLQPPKPSRRDTIR